MNLLTYFIDHFKRCQFNIKYLYSMYTLYHHFLQKVKEQEIEKYNQKHKAYLVRAGKISANDNKFQRRNNVQTNQNKNDNIRANPKMQQTQMSPPIQNETKMNEGKPKRQRQFNRPGRNPQKQSTFPEYQPKPQIRSTISQQNVYTNIQEQNISYNFKQSENQYRQDANLNDRPIKQSKLTPEEIQYLSQQNQRKNQVVQKERQLNKQKIQQQPSQYEQVQLVECGICGRKFKQQALQKHQKICQKVFQQKRKPFEAKKTDEEAQILKKKEKDEPQNEKQAKWKKDSEAFRNNLKKARGQKVQFVEQDTRIPCPGCGRKFNEKAAQKHIQFCTKKPKR